jgi:hypothetical protein
MKNSCCTHVLFICILRNTVQALQCHDVCMYVYRYCIILVLDGTLEIYAAVPINTCMPIIYYTAYYIDIIGDWDWGWRSQHRGWYCTLYSHKPTLFVYL